MKIFILTNILSLLIFNSNSLADDSELKIAFVIPLSGEWAFLGEGVKNGGLLAERDW